MTTAELIARVRELAAARRAGTYGWDEEQELMDVAPLLADMLERAMEVLHGLDTETYCVEDASQYIEEIEAMAERGVA